MQDLLSKLLLDEYNKEKRGVFVDIYIVREGDTLWKIAQSYGISYQRLMTDNGIKNQNSLVIGQALLILYPQTIHRVTSGQTLFSIANDYNTNVITLIQNNPSLAQNPSIYPGQQITIDFEGRRNIPIVVNGYAYPNIQPNILRQSLPYLTNLIIFGYGFNEDGSLIEIPDEPLIAAARQFAASPIMLISSIDRTGSFSTQLASTLFQSEQMQNTLLENVLAKMKQKGYDGLEIDFEYVSPDDAAAFEQFIIKATELMNSNGYETTVALAPKTSATQQGLLYEAHNYQRIGSAANRIMLMTYEWGYTYHR